VPQRAPLHGGGAADHDGGGQPPPRHAEAWPPGRAGSRRVEAGLDRREPTGPPLVAVEHQAAERGQDERHQEDVQQGRPGQHEVHPVEGQQQSGGAAEDRRAEQPARDPDQQEHRQRAEHGSRDPPAELTVGEPATVPAAPEQPFPDADEPFAQRGMDHEVAPVVLGPPLDPVVEQLLTLGGVVDLVEDLAGWVGQADEAERGRDEDDHAGGKPRLRIPGGARLQAPPHLLRHRGQ
jgi:hypothetical protein